MRLSITKKFLNFPDVDSADLIPSSFKSSINAFDANCGPLSEIILFGSPNCL